MTDKQRNKAPVINGTEVVIAGVSVGIARNQSEASEWAANTFRDVQFIKHTGATKRVVATRKGKVTDKFGTIKQRLIDKGFASA